MWRGCLVAVLWILWAYTPDWMLKSLSITNYPDRYWAVAVPMYFGTLIVYIVVIYNAWNLCNTYPFESYHTIRGAVSCGTRLVLCPSPTHG